MTYRECISENHDIATRLGMEELTEARSDLTGPQAWEALKLAMAVNHSVAGITLEAIERAAHTLYGWPPEPVLA
jgi:hypothetical protein